MEAIRAVNTNAESIIAASVVENEGRFCPWHELSTLANIALTVPNQRQYTRKIRRELKTGLLYTVDGADGIVFFSQEPENTPTLEEIGISPFSQPEEDSQLVVDSLSVLTPAIHENDLINASLVIDLMNRLVVHQQNKGLILAPFITPAERALLGCLAQGGFWSAEKLARTTGISPLNQVTEKNKATVKTHIRNLRQKLALTNQEGNRTRPAAQNLRLATIKRYSKVILCEAEKGDEVNLPGLYDFSKISEDTTAQLMPIVEAGRLKDNITVSPNFPSTEANIILILAKTPNQFISIDDLEDQLWGDERFDKGPDTINSHVSSIRSKFENLGAKMKIERQQNAYCLLLDNS